MNTLESKFELDIKPFIAAMQQIAKLAANGVDLGFNIDDDALKAAMQQINNLDGESVSVSVSVDDSELVSADKKVEKLNGQKANVKVDADVSELDKALKKFEEIGPKLKEGLDPSALIGGIAGGIGGIAAGLGESLLSGIGEAVSAGFEFQKTLGDIQLQLGITADQASKLGDEAEQAFAKGVGENAAEAAKIVAGLAKSFKLDVGSSQLSDIAIQAQRVGDAFGKDAEEIGQLGSQLSKQFGTSAKDSIDLVAVGLQGANTATADLLDTIGEFSVNFKAAGFSANEFIGTLKKAEGFNTALIGDAIKELGIRLAAGDIKSSLEGLQGTLDKGLLKSIGNMQDLASKGVISQKEFLSSSLTQIKDQYDKGLIDAAQAQQLQVSLLGSKAEDLGFDQVNKAFINPEQAGKNAEKAVENVAAVFKAREKDLKLSDISGGFSAAIASIGNAIASFIGKYILPLVEGIKNAFSGFDEGGASSGIIDTVMKIYDAFEQVRAFIVIELFGGVARVFNLIKGVVIGVVDSIKASFKSDSDGPSFLDTLVETIQKLRLLFEKLTPPINKLFGTVGKAIGSVVRITMSLSSILFKVVQKIFDFGGAANDSSSFIDKLGGAIDTVIGFIDDLTKGIDLGLVYFNKFMDIITDIGAAVLTFDLSKLKDQFTDLIGLFTGETKVDIPVDVSVNTKDANAEYQKFVDKLLNQADDAFSSLSTDQVSQAFKRNFKGLDEGVANVFEGYDTLRAKIIEAGKAGELTTDQQAALLASLDKRFKISDSIITKNKSGVTALAKANEALNKQLAAQALQQREQLEQLTRKQQEAGRFQDNEADAAEKAKIAYEGSTQALATLKKALGIVVDANGKVSVSLKGSADEVLAAKQQFLDLQQAVFDAAAALDAANFQFNIAAPTKSLAELQSLVDRSATGIEKRYAKVGEFVQAALSPNTGRTIFDQANDEIDALGTSIPKLKAAQEQLKALIDSGTVTDPAQLQTLKDSFIAAGDQIVGVEDRIKGLKASIKDLNLQGQQIAIQIKLNFPEGSTGATSQFDRLRQDATLNLEKTTVEIQKQFDDQLALYKSYNLDQETFARISSKLEKDRAKALKQANRESVISLKDLLKQTNAIYGSLAAIGDNIGAVLFPDTKDVNDKLADTSEALDNRQALLESNLRLGIISYQDYNDQLNQLNQERIDAEKAAEDEIAKARMQAINKVGQEALPALQASFDKAALSLSDTLANTNSSFSEIADASLEVLGATAAQSIGLAIAQSTSLEDIGKNTLKNFVNLMLDQLSAQAITAILGGTLAEVASKGLVGLITGAVLTVAVQGAVALAKGQLQSIIGYQQGGLIEGGRQFIGVDSYGRLIQANEQGQEFIVNSRSTNANLDALSWVNEKPGRKLEQYFATTTNNVVYSDQAIHHLTRTMDHRLSRLETVVDRAIRDNAGAVRSQHGIDVRVASDPGTSISYMRKQAKINSARG